MFLSFFTLILLFLKVKFIATEMKGILITAYI